MGVSSKPAVSPGAAVVAELDDEDELLLDELEADALLEEDALLLEEAAELDDPPLEQAARPRLATMMAVTAKHARSFLAFLVCSIAFLPFLGTYYCGYESLGLRCSLV